MISFKSLTRQIEIGANCYLLQFGNKRIIIDSGMHPKEEGKDSLPDFSSLYDHDIDSAILSHAHLDHSGSLPILQRHYPEMPVIMTESTSALSQALLHNSVNVMTSKRNELGLDEYPFFSHREIHKISKQWFHRRTERKFDLDNEGEIECTFYDAGHVLGAIGALIEYKGKKLFYTGDVHFEDQSIIKGADFPTENIDVLILECTRGSSPRSPDYTRLSEAEKLASSIENCLDQGGSVMIPLFAMGKTQETVTMLYELQRAKKLRRLSFLIGGLSIKMTKIYDRFSSSVRRNHLGMKLMREKGLLSTPNARGEIPKIEKGTVYTLSSGMMTEKTLSNRLARHFITNPRNLIASVGYADPESPLAKVLNSEIGQSIELDSNYDSVKRECSVASFDFSGHAPREALLDYAERTNPSKIILVHGDKSSIEWMKNNIKQRLPDAEIHVPQPQDEIEL
ncbi:MAG: MBL fold metallo-hydrolase [Verrucomicrobiota bacterium]|nr:MBL fold metallo-hydrolase [Verrucomicrobiota bacterium]